MSDHDLIKYTSLLGAWAILLVLALTLDPDKIITRYIAPAPPPKLTKFVPKPPSCCGDSICLMMHHHD